jgi:hypothetical protein
MDEPQTSLRARGQVALNHAHGSLTLSGDLSMLAEQGNFSTLVLISANTTCIASYHIGTRMCSRGDATA